MSYKIRKAKKGELPRIYEIYATARQFMRDNGNYSQWDRRRCAGTASWKKISRQGNLYVLEDAVEDEE